MPLRRNDPIGLTDNPAKVSDPGRRSERVTEFRRRLAYIEQHYRVGRLLYGSVTDFNNAIRALKLEAAGGHTGKGKLRRLPPIIEVAISLHARRFAGERTGKAGAKVGCEDISKAATHLAECASPISHRPTAENLKHHVRGLMALIQEFSGEPVVPRRYRNSDYDPHFKPGASQLVPIMFRALDPSVTMSQLVTIAEEARREWAGRRPTFREYFPGYGLRPGPDDALVSPSGALVATFEPNIPTYFHEQRPR